MRYEDAYATVESVVLDAIASTSATTGLVADGASEVLLRQVMENLTDPRYSHVLPFLVKP